MSPEEIQKLVNLRMMLFHKFQANNDWKSNRNAIMREIDHIEVLEKAAIWPFSAPSAPYSLNIPVEP